MKVFGVEPLPPIDGSTFHSRCSLGSWSFFKMPFAFHSLEAFQKIRREAAQWRVYEQILLKMPIAEQDLLRGVLMVPTIDNRTDPGYERRLYDGFKDGLERIRAGRPLIDTPPPSPPRAPSYQEQIIQAGRELGYTTSAELSITLPPEPPLSPYQPSYERSPPVTPASTQDFNFSPNSNHTELPTPSPPRPQGPLQNHEMVRLGIIAKKRKEPATTRPHYPKKRRAHQLKFDDEKLKAVRSSPPRTRNRAKNVN